MFTALKESKFYSYYQFYNMRIDVFFSFDHSSLKVGSQEHSVKSPIMIFLKSLFKNGCVPLLKYLQIWGWVRLVQLS